MFGVKDRHDITGDKWRTTNEKKYIEITVEIGITVKYDKLPCVIVEESDLECCILLGLNFVESTGIELNFEKCQITKDDTVVAHFNEKGSQYSCGPDSTLVGAVCVENNNLISSFEQILNIQEQDDTLNIVILPWEDVLIFDALA